MKKRSVVILVLVLCVTLCGCCLKHEWTEANCEEPKNCAECGKTEGEALGHEWILASCEVPDTCMVCGKTEGNAAGHIPGEVTESINIVKAETTYTECCTICGAKLSEECQQMDSLAWGDLFIFSPKEFLERMAQVAKEQFPDFRYEIAEENGAILAYLVFDKTDTLVYSIVFHNMDTTPIASEHLDRRGIWGISFNAVESGSIDEIDPFRMYGNADILSVFCRTCDLDITEEELGMMSMMKLTTLANYLDFSEPVGYYECSGHDYEFGYGMFEDENQRITSIQGVCIYPTDALY